MRLAVQEVHTPRTGCDHGIGECRLAAEHRVNTGASMNAQAVGDRPATHITLKQQHTTTRTRNRLSQGNGNRGLTLVGDRGGHDDGANRIVDGRETNISSKRFDRVLHMELIDSDFLLLLRHISDRPSQPEYDQSPGYQGSPQPHRRYEPWCSTCLRQR